MTSLPAPFGESELWSRCKLRARTAIVQAAKPITPATSARIIAEIERVIGCMPHTAEAAYNAALAEVAEDMAQ